MSRRLLLLLCVSVPSFMINLDANIVAVSLTSIAHSLHADFAAIEWVISAYTLTFASFLLPAGALADKFGRKRLLVAGLSIFTLASWVCGAAGSVTVLNIARAVQGLGAAIQLSAALAILSHGFRGIERAKAFAFWGSVIGIAAMLGPVAGGLMTQTLGWQWSFYVNVPVGVIMVALVAFVVEESRDPISARLDTPGVLTFSTFLALLTWALISGNREGWSSAAVLGKVAIALLLLATFGAIERRSVRPMIDLQYFFRSTYLGANTAAIAYAFTFLTMLTYLPLFFQSVLRYSPLAAGVLMLPLAIPLFVMPKIVSRYFDHRASGRVLLTAGLVLVGCGLAVTAVEIASLEYMRIVVPMFVAAIGAGILNGQAPKVGMTVIPVERAGMASGVAGTMRFSGIVIGFAALGALLYAGVTQKVDASGDVLAGPAERLALIHAITNANSPAIAAAIEGRAGGAGLVQAAIVQGYVYLIAAAAVFSLIAAIVAWVLISAKETAPHGKDEEMAVEILVE
jgi:EmrB/QacA subfamily drug resistance transporter